MKIRDGKKKIGYLEIIKWTGILLLLVSSLISNYALNNYDLYIKNIVIYIIMFISLCILLTTKMGKLIIFFVKEANSELQKVVWPTYIDSLNTTFVIILVTIIISMILWGLDTLLVRLISFGLRF